MSKSNFSVSLKCIVRGFFKDAMIIKDGSVLGYAPTEEQQRLCFKLVHLVLDDNGFFKPDTKNWLIGKNVYGGCADNPYTSRSRINYDLTKLSKALGEKSLDRIYRKSEGFTEYESLIDSLSEKYSSRSILDVLIFKVNHQNVMVGNNCDIGVDKINVLEIFETYTKERIRQVERSITPQMIEYVKYLERNKDSLEGEDREIWDCISSAVNNIKSTD